MKIGLLGTGFGIAHAGIYHSHPEVDEVVVFGRTPAKLRAMGERFGHATTTDIDRIYYDPEVDLIDVCLPTPLHADQHLGGDSLPEVAGTHWPSRDHADLGVNSVALGDQGCHVLQWARFMPWPPLSVGRASFGSTPPKRVVASSYSEARPRQVRRQDHATILEPTGRRSRRAGRARSRAASAQPAAPETQQLGVADEDSEAAGV